jgi:hypothetical protein
LAGEEIEARVLAPTAKWSRRTERVFKASELRRPAAVRTPAVAVAAACSTCPTTNNLP